MPRTKIIAIGNVLRGDDAAGVMVGDVLRKRDLPHVEVIGATGEGTELMESWHDADAVIIVDASRSGGAPGTVIRLDAHAASIPSAFFHYSTHAFSVAEAVELARVLGDLPARLVIFGIEGATFAAGAPVTQAVREAVFVVANRIEKEVLQIAGVEPCA